MAAILLSILIPTKRLDIAKLEPVEAIAITIEDGMVCLSTDTQAVGEGSSVDEAVKALKENAEGLIYLDTARFMLVGENAWEEAGVFSEMLRSDVRIAPYMGTDVKEEAKRLDAHDLSTKPWG